MEQNRQHAVLSLYSFETHSNIFDATLVISYIHFDYSILTWSFIYEFFAYVEERWELQVQLSKYIYNIKYYKYKKNQYREY